MTLANGNSSSSHDLLLQGRVHAWHCALNYINSMAIKSAIELGIPDAIHKHGHPMTLSQLVTALQVNPAKADGLRRLMRLLVHSGFFAQQDSAIHRDVDDDREQVGEEEGEVVVFYKLTSTSRFFLKDEPYSALQFAVLNLDEFSVASLNSLSEWLRGKDSTSFETAHGMTMWDVVERNPGFKKKFVDLMASDSKVISSSLVNDCKDIFQGVTSLVDVGGSTGNMARAIANAFPDISCSVLDLPHVVANCEGTDNLSFVGGDMFVHVPEADAVLLKLILHDWNDEDCVKILNRCKEAVKGSKNGGKVIIIDVVIGVNGDEKEKAGVKLLSDVIMMSYFNAKERDVKEWNRLFKAAGFRHHKIISIPGAASLIEAYP